MESKDAPKGPRQWGGHNRTLELKSLLPKTSFFVYLLGVVVVDGIEPAEVEEN